MINSSALMMGDEGYQISRSVRLRSSASAYFNRTFGSPTDNKKFTISFWMKRGKLGAQQSVFGAYSSATDYTALYFDANDKLNFTGDRSNANLFGLTTSAVYRDPSAWYHIVAVFDSANATTANRCIIYVNGVSQTLTGTTVPSGASSYVNTNAVVAGLGMVNSAYTDGYLTEINFVDGQALTPSSFGETDAVTGVWKPKKYGGTYGTNGFYLNFSDNSSNTATTIGKDYSGNGNNWTPNNISVTSGVTYDSMLDTPTPYADGGNGRGNYAVLNPLSLGSTVTLSNGNLTMTEVGTYATTVSSVAMTSGKWYAEMTVGSNTYAGTVGIAKLGYSPTSRLGFQANTWSYNNDGGLYYNSTSLATVSSYTAGDVIGIAFDATNLTIDFYKNNTLQGTQYTSANSGLSAGEFYFATGHINSTSNWNFGQRPFAYTPPTGFKALNTFNLPTPTIVNGATVMAATLYTGDGSYPRSVANTVNGVSFQPDLVWMKARSIAYDNILYDSIRGTGTGASLISNSSSAEGADAVNANMSAFASNGFTIGSTSSTNILNASGQTFVAWQWKAGGTSSSNTNGSITSTVSVGATQGFSVVQFTATGATATVGHGLGVAPKMIIVKDAASTGNWAVWHTSLTSTAYYLFMNTTAAQANTSAIWTGTPSSTTFGIGSWHTADRQIAYCFAEVAGYSKFGSYTGNGSTDGPFVNLNFRPKLVITKSADATAGVGDWTIHDTSRLAYNTNDLRLFANASSAESSSEAMDMLSNGFKIRATNSNCNTSGGGYIYMAFAENPFKLSLAR